MRNPSGQAFTSQHTSLVLLLPVPSHNPCNAAADGATAIAATKKYPIPKKKNSDGMDPLAWP